MPEKEQKWLRKCHVLFCTKYKKQAWVAKGKESELNMRHLFGLHKLAYFHWLYRGYIDINHHHHVGLQQFFFHLLEIEVAIWLSILTLWGWALWFSSLMKGHQQTIPFSGQSSVSIASFSKYSTLLSIHTIYLRKGGLQMQEQFNFIKDSFLSFTLIIIFSCLSKTLTQKFS